MVIPEFRDVLLAQQRIRPYLIRTPLHRYPALDAVIGTEVYVKHENYQIGGAFKVRGGINLVSQLSEADRRRGLLAASAGNHGFSIAYACKLFGVAAHIVVPEDATPGKVANIRATGAEVIVAGKNFDEARKHGEQIAKQQNYRYVGIDPLMIAGVATEALEMLEDQPDLDVIFVPVGGGSGAAGCSIAAHAINPNIQVIAVQSAQAPAGYHSWHARKVLTAENTSIVDGISTSTGFPYQQQILWEHLDDFVLVEDDLVLQAMVWLAEHAHTLVESAGAAALAAAYSQRERFAGKRIGVICTGGNASIPLLKQALDRFASA